MPCCIPPAVGLPCAASNGSITSLRECNDDTQTSMTVDAASYQSSAMCGFQCRSTTLLQASPDGALWMGASRLLVDGFGVDFLVE